MTRAQDAIALLERLVAYPTISSDSNFDLIALLAERAEALGGVVERFPAPGQPKANLVCRFGPFEGGGLALAGHTDVVPVDGQAWSSDPFRLRAGATNAGDPAFFARGAADMKGFLALSVAATARLDLQRLRRPLWWVWTHDEEVGCVGAQLLASAWQTRAAPRPAWALVGEPTEWRARLAHKGHARMAVTIKGVPCHSAYPDRGVNAIVHAARAVDAISRLGRELRALKSDQALFDDLPFPTLNVGRIEGGTAVNIVPEHCRIELGARTMPGQDARTLCRRLREHLEAELLPALAVAHADAGVQVEFQQAAPAFAARERTPLWDACAHALGEDPAGAVAFTTEAGVFEAAGVKSLVCGPGSIHQAHRADEYVTLDHLERGAAILDAVIERCCVTGGGSLSPAEPAP